MYNNEEKTTKPVRRRNEVKELKILLTGKTFKITYSIDALREILMSDIFDKIQIPVYMHNSTLFKEGKKGITAVGHIISYNPEKDIMKLAIYNRFVEKIDAIEDAIVYPRIVAVFNKPEDLGEDAVVENIKILGFDIASESFYNN